MAWFQGMANRDQDDGRRGAQITPKVADFSVRRESVVGRAIRKDLLLSPAGSGA
jgi:hypothetical protein